MKKFKKGFTLIELMIVLSIVGIVAAVFLPMFTGKGSIPNSSGYYDGSQGYTQQQGSVTCR